MTFKTKRRKKKQLKYSNQRATIMQEIKKAKHFQNKKQIRNGQREKRETQRERETEIGK